MKTSIYISVLILLFSINHIVHGQVLTLNEIKAAIRSQHPTAGMFDAEAASMDVATQGAWSWMPPEVGTGFFYDALQSFTNP